MSDALPWDDETALAESPAIDADAAEPLAGPMRPSGFAEWFVVAQTAIPALLFLPGSQALRLPIRVGAYGIALAGLALWCLRGRPRTLRHPSEGWLWVAGLWLAIMIAHPQTSTLAAGIGQTVLYVAVFSALFWAPSHVDRPQALVRILAILLICNGLNATVGVLQVYDPGRWMPPELSFAFGERSTALATAVYKGANGRLIIRPPGLFDSPGAVCGPGTVAAVLGLIFAAQPLAWWQRLGSLALSVAGLAAIYLSHVRANFVITLGMMVVYGGLLMVQRERRRAATFVGLSALVLVTAFLGSSLLGGESIGQRFATLFAEDPRALYFASRGAQLSHGVSEFVTEYPFGAGLARWGMMNLYFADPSNLDAPALWAEIQPNAWALDGGPLLIVLYTGALLGVGRAQWQLVRQLPGDDRRWAAAVMAVNAGTIALVFSFVPFTTQVGLQFWFLEGALHGAMIRRLYPDA